MKFLALFFWTVVCVAGCSGYVAATVVQHVVAAVENDHADHD